MKVLKLGNARAISFSKDNFDLFSFIFDSHVHQTGWEYTLSRDSEAVELLLDALHIQATEVFLSRDGSSILTYRDIMYVMTLHDEFTEFGDKTIVKTQDGSYIFSLDHETDCKLIEMDDVERQLFVIHCV